MKTLCPLTGPELIALVEKKGPVGGSSIWAAAKVSRTQLSRWSKSLAHPSMRVYLRILRALPKPE